MAGRCISVVEHDLAVRPSSEELWVTPWSSDRAIIIDLKARKEVAGFRVGRSPSHKHLAFTDDGSEAWVTEPESGSLFVVNALTRTVVERVKLGGHPHHLRFAAGQVYVAVGPKDLVVLDVRTRGVIGRLAVGSEIHDIGLLPPK
jgi:YVTN family beta-propeller protein